MARGMWPLHAESYEAQPRPREMCQRYAYRVRILLPPLLLSGDLLLDGQAMRLGDLEFRREEVDEASG